MEEFNDYDNPYDFLKAIESKIKGKDDLSRFKEKTFTSGKTIQYTSNDDNIQLGKHNIKDFRETKKLIDEDWLLENCPHRLNFSMTYKQFYSIYIKHFTEKKLTTNPAITGLYKKILTCDEFKFLDMFIDGESGRRLKFDSVDCMVPKDACTLDHNGQFKLLASELLFLTIASKFTKNTIRGIQQTEESNNGSSHESHDLIPVVYAGSAAGYHIPVLAQMFPNVLWILYDPNPFFPDMMELSTFHSPIGDDFSEENKKSRIEFLTKTFMTDGKLDHAKVIKIAKKHSNYIIVNDYFEDSDAEFMNGLFGSAIDWLFISDIRASIDENRIDGNINIERNEKQQTGWVKKAKPFMYELKMRGIWGVNKVIEYPWGIDFNQAVMKPHTSAETRTIGARNSKGEIEIMKVEQSKREEILFHDNIVMRSIIFNLENPHTICHCRDCIESLYIIKLYLNELTTWKPDKIDEMAYKVYRSIMESLKRSNYSAPIKIAEEIGIGDHPVIQKLKSMFDNLSTVDRTIDTVVHDTIISGVIEYSVTK